MTACMVGWITLALAGGSVGLATVVIASDDAWPKAAVEAWDAHESGDYEDAIGRYRDAIDGGDFRPELPFNLGNALFRRAMQDLDDPAPATVAGPPGVPGGAAGTPAPAAAPTGPDPTLIDAALDSFDRAAGTGDTGLRARALTNAGTLRATRGEAEEAMELFKEALRLDPGDMRARYNLEFLMSQPPPAESDSTANSSDSEDPSENTEPSEDAPPDSSGSQPPEPDEGENEESEPTPNEPEPEPEPQDPGAGEETPPQEESSDAEPTLSPEEARRELDRLEELERELLKALLAAKRRKTDVEKDW